jgi:hypothetical protein
MRPNKPDFLDASLEASTQSLSRRTFVEAAVFAGTGLTAASIAPNAFGGSPSPPNSNGTHDGSHTVTQFNGEKAMSEDITLEKIRRARLSGPDSVTREATVAEMNADGGLSVLRQGTNQWVCVPGNQNIIGQADMCMDPMGMRWMLDVIAKKPKPTNATPGLIYMLNGATQRSYTDPFDRTSPAIPIGPHWMILWPFDAKAAGLPTVMRDTGTLIMFAGTPYAHLHICGSPWDGNKYHAGDRGVWTMSYARP